MCIRALYPRIVSEPSVLQTAYTVDSVLVEAFLSSDPRSLPRALRWAPRSRRVARSDFGRYRQRGLHARGAGASVVARRIATQAHVARRPPLSSAPRRIQCHAAYSIAFGLFEVAVTAHAARKGAPAAAGIALALASPAVAQARWSTEVAIGAPRSSISSWWCSHSWLVACCFSSRSRT